MNDPNTNNFHTVVKQVNRFDGKRSGDFLESEAKLRTAFSLYNRPIFIVLQGVQRPPSENTGGATDFQNTFCALFFSTSGSAVSVVRRFEGKRPQEEPGYGQ